MGSGSLARHDPAGYFESQGGWPAERWTVADPPADYEDYLAWCKEVEKDLPLPEPDDLGSGQAFEEAPPW